jgi:hypothetical protein
MAAFITAAVRTTNPTNVKLFRDCQNEIETDSLWISFFNNSASVEACPLLSFDAV